QAGGAGDPLRDVRHENRSHERNADPSARGQGDAEDERLRNPVEERADEHRRPRTLGAVGVDVLTVRTPTLVDDPVADVVRQGTHQYGDTDAGGAVQARLGD